MNRGIKTTFINTFVQSVALYGYGTYVINKVEKRSLETFEICCWRRMEKISWVKRITNMNILTQVKEAKPIMKIIMRRRWDIMRHVLSCDEELRHTIIEGAIERWKRLRYRPRNLYISLLKKMWILKFID